MHSKLPTIVLAIAVAFGASACSSDDDTGNPVTPSPSVTDLFDGTLTPNGGVTHDFSVTSLGDVTATLATLAPVATETVGLSLGTWNGTVCSVVVSNDRATQGTVITARAGSAGRLCVRIHDAGGTLSQALTYEIRVLHP